MFKPVCIQYDFSSTSAAATAVAISGSLSGIMSLESRRIVYEMQVESRLVNTHTNCESVYQKENAAVVS